MLWGPKAVKVQGLALRPGFESDAVFLRLEGLPLCSPLLLFQPHQHSGPSNETRSRWSSSGGTGTSCGATCHSSTAASCAGCGCSTANAEDSTPPVARIVHFGGYPPESAGSGTSSCACLNCSAFKRLALPYPLGLFPTPVSFL